jgi:hypothetical protein
MAQEFIYVAPRLVLCKAETTYGSDPTPAGANALRCRKFEAKVKWETVEVERHRATVPANKRAVVAVSWEIEIEIDVKGPDAPVSGGAPVLAPEVDVLLEACQYISTPAGSPVTSFAYAPVSAGPQKSCAFYIYSVADGGTYELHKALGCVGSWKLVVPTNGVAYWSFSLRGLYAGAPAAATPLPTPTYRHGDDMVPGRGCAISYGDMSQVVTKTELDSGAKVTERRQHQATYGYAGFATMLGQPTLKLDPEALPEGSFGLEAAILAHTTDGLELTVPTVGGGEWVFTAAEAQVMNASASGDEIKRHELELCCTDTNGDDSLTFTCARAA